MSGQRDSRPAKPGTRFTLRRAGAILAVLAVVVVAGCSKSPATSAGNGSTAPSAAAAGGDGCAAGATKNTEGGFCLSLPATQKPHDPFDKNETSRAYDYGDGIGKGVAVVVTKMKDASQWDYEVSSLASEAKSSNHTQQEATDLAGGGKYWSWAADDGYTWVTVLTHKDTKLLFCRTYGSPVDPALVDACKSIRPL